MRQEGARRRYQAGLANLLGLLAVARHAGPPSFLASASAALTTPSVSRSVQYAGVPGCCRHESSRPIQTTAVDPTKSDLVDKS